MNRYFTQELVDAVKWVHNTFDGKVIFCGSFGLVLNGKLKRFVHDIDAFSEVDYLSDTTLWGKIKNGTYLGRIGSGNFEMDNEPVSTIKFLVPNTIVTVDFFHRKTLPEYDIIEFDGLQIKVEKAQGAIDAKRQYVKSAQNGNRQKHIDDLNFMGVNDIEIDKNDDLPF